MKYFLDTEFIEDGTTIDLISIGIVAEDGREFYGQSTEFDAFAANTWVAANVFPHLENCYRSPDGSGIFETYVGRWDTHNHCAKNCPWYTRQELKEAILNFVGDDEQPEFWGYYADYDWVVFCWLFGAMVDLPEGWPMYCRDIKQLCDDLGTPVLPVQVGAKHNALSDARWNKLAWEFLQKVKSEGGEG